MRKFLGVVAFSCFLAAPADAGQIWTFDLLPTGGAVSAKPGATAGWSYTITNQDLSDWLVLSNFSSDGFQSGVGRSLFDFPIVGPNSTVTVPYDGVRGLFEFTWDIGVALGSTNSGVFTVSADWFDGDPLQGGILIAPAPDQSSPYSVVAAAVPEPASWFLVAFGVLWLARRGRAGRGPVG